MHAKCQLTLFVYKKLVQRMEYMCTYSIINMSSCCCICVQSLNVWWAKIFMEITAILSLILINKLNYYCLRTINKHVFFLSSTKCWFVFLCIYSWRGQSYSNIFELFIVIFKKSVMNTSNNDSQKFRQMELNRNLLCNMFDWNFLHTMDCVN